MKATSEVKGRVFPLCFSLVDCSASLMLHTAGLVHHPALGLDLHGVVGAVGFAFWIPTQIRYTLLN